MSHNKSHLNLCDQNNSDHHISHHNNDSCTEEHVTNRYYLHHHAPDHTRNSFSALKKHMSTSALGQLLTNSTEKNLLKKNKSNHHMNTWESKNFSTINMNLTGQSNEINFSNDLTTDDNFDTHMIIKNHVFVRASCSRLRELCEACEHTVHGHAYIYCKNCPVVVHLKTSCQEQLQRICPAPELGVTGWGESKHQIKFDENSSLDLEAVFLSGMIGLQSNKCFECGCVLDPAAGRELLHLPDDKEHCAPKPEAHSKIIKHFKHSRKPESSSTLKNVKSDHHMDHITYKPEAKITRICHLNGKFYCDNCHWNDQWYVPGSIFLLNDVNKQPISRSNYLKLRVSWDSIIYRIPNYWLTDNLEAARVFAIRSQLHELLRYTLVCSTASSLKSSAEITDPSHLLGYPDYLRMCDVLEILNGSLYTRLESYYKTWSEHISSCEVCIKVQKPIETENTIWLGNKVV